MTLSHAQTAADDCPREVRVGLLSTFAPPYVVTSETGEGAPEGLFASWAREGAGTTHCRPAVKLLTLPRLRAYQRLEQGQLDFFLPTVPSVASLAQFAFPMSKGEINSRMAFDVAGASLWVRKGETAIQWDGVKLKGPPGFEVGVAQLSPSETLAKTKGWKLSVGKSPANTVDRLAHGRVAVILVSDLVVEAFPPEVLAGLTRLNPPLERYEYQAAGSKAFVSRYPRFAQEFWQGLCRAGRSHAHERAGGTRKNPDVCH